MTEKQVLGGILADPNILDEVVDKIESKWFHEPYDKVWTLILTAYENKIPIDSVSLYELSLKKQFDLPPSVFNELLEVTSSANVEYNIAVLNEKFLQAEALKKAEELKLKIDKKEDIFESIETHIQDMMNMTSTKDDRGEEVSVVTKRVVDHIEKIHSGNSSNMWVDSGFYELDNFFKFGNSDLVYIAARPGMGKTSFMLSLAKSMCKDGYVGVFSLEMSNEQLTTRLISSECGIPYLNLLSGQVKTEEGSSIARASHKVSQMKLFTDDSGGLTPIKLMTKARRMKKKYGIKALFIDYIGLMQYQPLSSNKNAELTYISARLKALAKDLNIPVIVLSQLSRAVESRSDKRPTLVDLRDSGSLEQDADSVIMLYRGDYYGDTTLENGDSCLNTCEVLVRKQRNGAIGSIVLGFDKTTTKFKNLEAFI